MEKDDLFKLYRLVIEQEQFYITEHHKRTAFYTGLISTLIAATVTGIFYAEEWYHFIPVLIGPILVVKLSSLAKRGTMRSYQRFLEAITMKSKVEEDLCLTKERSKDTETPSKSWVTTEPLVTKRHMNSRVEGDYKTSKEWVDGHLVKKENYHGVTMRIFGFASFLGWLLFAFTGVIIIIKLLVAFGLFIYEKSIST